MGELQDLVALLRAETPLLVIETPDEARVVELFRQSMAYAWRAQYRWSVTEGPWYDNNLALLELAPAGLRLWWNAGAVIDDPERPVLTRVATVDPIG